LDWTAILITDVVDLKAEECVCGVWWAKLIKMNLQ
jgi:hypothetical protein